MGFKRSVPKSSTSVRCTTHGLHLHGLEFMVPLFPPLDDDTGVARRRKPRKRKFRGEQSYSWAIPAQVLSLTIQAYGGEAKKEKAFKHTEHFHETYVKSLEIPTKDRILRLRRPTRHYN